MSAADMGLISGIQGTPPASQPEKNTNLKKKESKDINWKLPRIGNTKAKKQMKYSYP